MADRIHKKRGRQSQPGPTKKCKKQKAYHSDSDSGDALKTEKAVGGAAATDFAGVNLLDSDDDIENAKVDEGDSVSASSSEEDPDQELRKAGWEAESDEDGGVEEEEESDAASDAVEDAPAQGRATKSKRNDPSAFATSLSKILSTKLSSSRRDDPLLARSAAAHEASRAAADQALEAKARRKVREQKRRALERGRVRDPMLAVEGDVDHQQGGMGEGMRAMSAAEVVEEERRLRKVAQRGVVRLFNAVRAAQSTARKEEEGGIGVVRKGERVNEMSRKGFLELIASGGGGGGLSRKALGEA